MIKLIFLILFGCKNTPNETSKQNKKIKKEIDNIKEDNKKGVSRETLNGMKSSEKSEEESDLEGNSKRERPLKEDALELEEKLLKKELKKKELKELLRGNFNSLGDVLNSLAAKNDTESLEFLIKEFNIKSEIYLPLILNKYFKENRDLLSFIVSLIASKKDTFNVFLKEIENIKAKDGNEEINLNNLVQEVLRMRTDPDLFTEEIVSKLINTSISKFNSSTLDLLFEKINEIYSSEEPLWDFFKMFYNNPEYKEALGRFLSKNPKNFIQIKLKEILTFVLNNPVDQSLREMLFNSGNFLRLLEHHKSLNKKLFVKMINEVLDNYMENDYNKAKIIIKNFLVSASINHKDLNLKELYNKFYIEGKNKENFEALITFLFVDVIKLDKIDEAWQLYLALNLERDLNFIMFQKVYQKANGENLKKLLSKQLFLDEGKFYNTLQLDIVNFVLNKRKFKFNDRGLTLIFINIFNSLERGDIKKELKFALSICKELIKEIKDFNTILQENITIAEQIIDSISNNKNEGNNNEMKDLIEELWKLHLQRRFVLSETYYSTLNKLKG